jgi:hypothetical protein
VKDAKRGEDTDFRIFRSRGEAIERGLGGLSRSKRILKKLVWHQYKSAQSAFYLPKYPENLCNLSPFFFLLFASFAPLR